MLVEYIDHMGDDLRTVNSARVSFNKESDTLSDKDERLVKYLAEHDHFTPFTHCHVTLRETVPLFVARQRFKHTVGFTYNEVSRRYVSDSPSFFIPSDNEWRLKAEDKKQGSKDETVPVNPAFIQQYYDGCVAVYQKLLDTGVAPEQARMVLPQSMYTSYYVSGSLAAFARAYRLRSQPDAQAEIRYVAAEWDKIIRPLFPHSWSALVD